MSLFEEFTKELQNKILDTTNAAVPADIGMLPYRDGGIELLPGQIIPCYIPTYLREREESVEIDGEKKTIKFESPLKDGDQVIYARTSKIRQYIILGKVNG